MSNLAVELRNVHKSLGNFSLDIEDLTLERGYVLGLVGQNGAGKSTTIKLLMNLLYPSKGQIRVLGLEQPVSAREIKRKVGYVSENPSFYEKMSVNWMAKLVSKYYPTWDWDLYKQYLGKFKLESDKKVEQLSKGMKVKLALTLALSHRPELLILDEPTSGVDPVVRRELLKEIADIIRDDSRSVIFSSHITKDIEQVADYVAIVEDGRIAEFADKETLLEKWKKVTGNAADCSQLQPFFATLRTEGSSFVGTTSSYSPEWLDKLRSLGAHGLRTYNLNLDEILLSVIGKEL